MLANYLNSTIEYWYSNHAVYGINILRFSSSKIFDVTLKPFSTLHGDYREWKALLKRRGGIKALLKRRGGIKVESDSIWHDRILIDCDMIGLWHDRYDMIGYW